MGHLMHVENMGNAYKILLQKCKGIRPVGRPRHAWKVDMCVIYNSFC
jgi:hypothetical protein